MADINKYSCHTQTHEKTKQSRKDEITFDREETEKFIIYTNIHIKQAFCMSFSLEEENNIVQLKERKNFAVCLDLLFYRETERKDSMLNVKKDKKKVSETAN